MRWVDVVWSMFAASSLSLALIHAWIWIKQPTRRVHAAFAIAALCVAVVTLMELGALRATTPGALATLYRWMHVPIAVLVVALVVYVHSRLRTGRPWIAITACVLRLLALALNFTTGANLNYQALTQVHQLAWWGGETVAYGTGTGNPFMLVAVASNLFLLAYLIDSWVRAERSVDAAFRSRARVICIAWIVFVLTMAGNALLISTLHLEAPFLGSLGFVVVILVTGMELGADVHRSALLADRLVLTQHDLALAMEAGGLASWSMQPDSLDAFIARVYEEDRETVLSALDNAIASRGYTELDYRRVDDDGQVRWACLRATHTNGGLRGIEQDITERRELSLQREKLARLSRVTSLGELSASLAHELNQPLASILSNTQAAQLLLDRDPVNLVEIREILGDIVEENRRANGIMAGLRGLFRNQSARQAQTDLNAVIQHVLRLLRNHLTTHAIDLQVELDPAAPPVHGDHVQLEQVILNLVMNACEAMTGQHEPRSLLLQTARSGTYAIVRIVDTGRGIPMEDLARVFDPFVSMREDGLGLGLSVCRTILRAHGGRIWAMRNAERGATFVVELPGASPVQT